MPEEDVFGCDEDIINCEDEQSAEKNLKQVLNPTALLSQYSGNECIH